MPTGVFCGVTPFFFRKKSELKARNETKKYASKKVRSSKSSKVQSPSRLSGNLVAMAELSSKISSFRDLLDFSPCLGSASVNELIILTLNDLFKCYPKIKPKSELQGASLHKALKILCGTLKSLGDLWTTKKWMVKCKYKSFKKLGHVELEQTALAMLDDIINLARERRFHVMDDDGDMKLRGYSPQSIASREAMSEYSENRTPFSASPETPTSVLQGTWKSASSREKGSCSPPLLVPPRVQAVGKLNRIDVKRLSFHMNPHVISLAQDPKYAILMNSIETEEPPSEMRPGNVIKEDVDDEKISGEMEMDNVDNRESEMKCESPRIAATGSVGKVDNDGRKLPALEASEEQEMHVRLSSSPPELPQNAAEQVAPPSLPTDQNISPSSPPSPPPTPITPRNLVPARLPPPQPPPPFPVPSGNTESPPPPPPLTALMNCAQPPPPPPMATSNGVEPSPPTLKSTAPPPPPPPTSITNGNGAAPPPPPPPTSISNGNGATPPPPPPPMGASKENGAAPPPPPMASASKGFEGMAPPPPGVLFLRPKKLATKLKRSSHIGNLYRVLKGKVEGSGLESKLSGRKGNAGGGGGAGGAGGGAAGGKQGMADALAEMTKRSAYFIQIEEDVKNYADNIKELKAKISSFQTSDMTELIQFHKYVESHLEKLADETQVLARFEDFPSKKLEALRMAAALYSKLDSIVATLQNWPVDEPVGKLLDKAESFFNKIKVDIDALERTKDDEAKRFQAHKITFDFGILLRIKELMVDVSSICMESALKEKEEAMDKDNKDGNPEKKKNEIAKILWRAFQFAFRVYTFAGGHDERADKLTRELAHEIEKEN